MESGDSKLKIERAEKHITDIKNHIAKLPELYVATIEVNPTGGNKVIKHDLRDRSKHISDLALTIGDAAHNLKCALDYAWLGTIERVAPQAVTKFAKFPVYPSIDELENALTAREISKTSPKLFRLMVREIKSYDGGNVSIVAVHDLNIRDKHRLLTPVIEFASIDGIELENERGQTEHIGTWPTSDHPPYYLPIESGWHIKDKGHVTVEILFQEGTPLYESEVLDELQLYSRAVLNVVELLETV
jgi:hypothetical protein